MRRTLRAAGLALFAAAVAGCAESPTQPDAEPTPDPSVEALLAAPGAEAVDGQGDRRAGGTLHDLLRRAVHTAAATQGEEAAQALIAELQELAADVEAARQSGDETALREAVRRLDHAAASIVLRVLGPAPLRHLIQRVPERWRELAELASRAEAAGRDVSDARAALQRARANLAEAHTLFESGRLPAALVRVARAADFLGAAEQALGVRHARTLHRLLRLSLERVAASRGEDAVHRLVGRLQELETGVRDARESGDEEAVRAAVDAFESEVARIVIDALGAEVVRHVLHAGAERLAVLASRIEELAAAGHDTSALAAVLETAGSIHAAALEAAAAGDAVAALRLGARALDVLSRH